MTNLHSRYLQIRAKHVASAGQIQRPRRPQPHNLPSLTHSLTHSLFLSLSLSFCLSLPSHLKSVDAKGMLSSGDLHKVSFSKRYGKSASNVIAKLIEALA